ncbi:MAG: SDR family NAD(P)-dependent oxidoreductase [Acidobacteria bacterium]|nr:MAG: SDR family NAD(P)-dependent oxidoreductase [Acidobacteriota bacterium]
MSWLRGKHVLLTGGSRGIGPFIAEALARRGANLALSARSETGLRAVAEALKPLGVRTVVIPADVAQPAQRAMLVRAALDAFGAIDVLVNNAGLETEGAFAATAWDRVRETIEVNLAAPMELTHLLLPQMLERRSAHVVNLSSVGGKSGTAYDAVYCGTKAGLAEWTHGLRQELAGTGVCFSTIFPSYVTEAGMFARFGVKAPWLAGSCTPQQVARAVVDAIERRKVEVIVSSQALRPLLALAALSPALGDWLVRRLGIVEFQRRKAGAPALPVQPDPSRR